VAGCTVACPTRHQRARQRQRDAHELTEQLAGLEERLVDAAQLLGAEVPVVHRPADAVLGREGERPDRVEEVVVRQLGGREVGDRLGRPEEAPEGREPERRVAP